MKTYGSDQRSINRNIVECKDRHDGLCNLQGTVLIETLWNVKKQKN